MNKILMILILVIAIVTIFCYVQQDYWFYTRTEVPDQKPQNEKLSKIQFENIVQEIQDSFNQAKFILYNVYQVPSFQQRVGDVEIFYQKKSISFIKRQLFQSILVKPDYSLRDFIIKQSYITDYFKGAQLIQDIGQFLSYSNLGNSSQNQLISQSNPEMIIQLLQHMVAQRDSNSIFSKNISLQQISQDILPPGRYMEVPNQLGTCGDNQLSTVIILNCLLDEQFNQRILNLLEILSNSSDNTFIQFAQMIERYNVYELGTQDDAKNHKDGNLFKRAKTILLSLPNRRTISRDYDGEEISMQLGLGMLTNDIVVLSYTLNIVSNILTSGISILFPQLAAIASVTEDKSFTKYIRSDALRYELNYLIDTSDDELSRIYGNFGCNIVKQCTSQQCEIQKESRLSGTTFKNNFLATIIYQIGFGMKHCSNLLLDKDKCTYVGVRRNQELDNVSLQKDDEIVKIRKEESVIIGDQLSQEDQLSLKQLLYSEEVILIYIPGHLTLYISDAFKSRIRSFKLKTQEKDIAFDFKKQKEFYSTSYPSEVYNTRKYADSIQFKLNLQDAENHLKNEIIYYNIHDVIYQKQISLQFLNGKQQEMISTYEQAKQDPQSSINRYQQKDNNMENVFKYVQIPILQSQITFPLYVTMQNILLNLQTSTIYSTEFVSVLDQQIIGNNGISNLKQQLRTKGLYRPSWNELYNRYNIQKTGKTTVIITEQQRNNQYLLYEKLIEFKFNYVGYSITNSVLTEIQQQLKDYKPSLNEIKLLLTLENNFIDNICTKYMGAVELIKNFKHKKINNVYQISENKMYTSMRRYVGLNDMQYSYEQQKIDQFTKETIDETIKYPHYFNTIFNLYNYSLWVLDNCSLNNRETLYSILEQSRTIKLYEFFGIKLSKQFKQLILENSQI